MNGQHSRRILVPEGLVEEVLRTTHHFTEEQCRGLFAAVETLLQVDTEYRSYRDLKATKSGVGEARAKDSRPDTVSVLVRKQRKLDTGSLR